MGTIIRVIVRYFDHSKHTIFHQSNQHCTVSIFVCFRDQTLRICVCSVSIFSSFCFLLSQTQKNLKKKTSCCLHHQYQYVMSLYSISAFISPFYFAFWLFLFSLFVLCS